MTDLEQQLRNYGDVVADMIDRTTERAMPAPREASRRPLARLGASALIGASIVAAIVVIGRSDDPDPEGTASPISSDAPATTPAQTATTEAVIGWPDAAVAACLEQTGAGPAEWGASPTASDPTIVLPIATDPPTVRVTITGTDTTASCTVTLIGGRTEVSDPSFGVTRSLLEVSADGVVIDDQSWMSNTEEGATGPGWYEASGRVGPEVVSVTLVLPDGTSAPATVVEGHFYGKVEARAGVALFDERVDWTLADGTTHSRRADLLDEQSPDEQCAATPGCVDERLAALAAAADGVEAEVLADLEVSEEEYRAALLRVADCANAAGGDVDLYGATLAIGGDTDMATLDRCQETHLEVIAQARSLLRARDRADDPST